MGAIRGQVDGRSVDMSDGLVCGGIRCFGRHGEQTIEHRQVLVERQRECDRLPQIGRCALATAASAAPPIGSRSWTPRAAPIARGEPRPILRALGGGKAG